MTVRTVAVVVLGARIHADGRPTSALCRRLDRTALAWHELNRPRIICSGGRSWNGHVEATRMRDHLVALGVCRSDILEELDSLSTAENAKGCARLLPTLDVRQVGLVTCPWHMRRALADFRLCGIEAMALPAQWGPMSRSQRAWRLAVEQACLWIDRARLTTGILR